MGGHVCPGQGPKISEFALFCGNKQYYYLKTPKGNYDVCVWGKPFLSHPTGSHELRSIRINRPLSLPVESQISSLAIWATEMSLPYHLSTLSWKQHACCSVQTPLWFFFFFFQTIPRGFWWFWICKGTKDFQKELLSLIGASWFM